jgi:hypothetical protein
MELVSTLKIIRNGMMGSFEKKINMLITCDPKVAHFALFPLGSKTLPLSSFLVLADGHVDF